MRMAFTTAIGVLIGLLMVGVELLESPLTMLLAVVNLPGIAACAGLSKVGLAPSTGFDSDLLAWIFLGTIMQWTFIGALVGCVLHLKDRRRVKG